MTNDDLLYEAQTRLDVKLPVKLKVKAWERAVKDRRTIAAITILALEQYLSTDENAREAGRWNDK